MSRSSPHLWAMKTIPPLAVMIIMFLISPRLPAAANRNIKIGVYENKPKIFTQPNGTPAGIFVDIIEDIARQEDWKLQYVHGSWDQCLRRLETGRIDLMADIAYSPERDKIYDFCGDDVICNWAQIYTRRGVDVTIITELDGLRVAAMKGDIHTDRFLNLAEGFGLRVEMTPVDDYESVFRLIAERKVDAGLVNRIYGYAHENQFAVNRSPVVFSPASLRFAVKDGRNADIIETIDQCLKAMKTEKGSTYHQSIRRWLGETSKLSLPHWIFWTLAAALALMALFALLNLILKNQVNIKTEHLRRVNAELEKQVQETMKAHLELKRNEEQLIRHERLSALGQLTSGISHDFNNMLFPIIGYADMLLKTPSLLANRDELTVMLECIRTSAFSSRDTVRRLQEFIRADSGQALEEVNVPQLVSEIVLAVKPLWKSQREAESATIKIIEEVTPGLHVILSKSQFREALMNLILNALHAIEKDGVITIRASVEDGQFVTQVIDTGQGMTREVANQCLEPFFTTKGQKGTGMGLAMVHGVVKRHKGMLEINSEPGRGTTITMRIPLLEESSGDAFEPSCGNQTSRCLKVLAVDDDEHARKLIAEYLEFDGHQPIVADGPTSAAAFDREEPDLVITDLSMPETSGRELAEHVKASGRPVPVIMISGFAHLLAAEDKKPEGVDLILGKPFTQDELRDAIERLFRNG